MTESGLVRESAVAGALAPAATPGDWVDEFDFDRADGGGQPARRRRWVRWLILPAVFLAIVVAVVWVAKPFATSATNVVTATATTGTVVSSVSISGSVASPAVNELSFGAAGSVTAVNVAPGDKVTDGQVLATIDDTALQVQLLTAQANLESAQARLATDQAGPTAATIASANDSVNQTSLQLSTARQSLSDTKEQNAQNVAQAKAALSAAKATLATDRATLPSGDPQLAKDQAAVTSAKRAASSSCS